MNSDSKSEQELLLQAQREEQVQENLFNFKFKWLMYTVGATLLTLICILLCIIIGLLVGAGIVLIQGDWKNNLGVWGWSIFGGLAAGLFISLILAVSSRNAGESDEATQRIIDKNLIKAGEEAKERERKRKLKVL